MLISSYPANFTIRASLNISPRYFHTLTPRIQWQGPHKWCLGLYHYWRNKWRWLHSQRGCYCHTGCPGMKCDTWKIRKKKTSLDANIIRRKHYFLSFCNATIDPEIRQGSSFSLYETSIIISLCNKKSNLCPELKLFSTTQYGVFVFHCVLLFDLGLALSSNNVQAKIA